MAVLLGNTCNTVDLVLGGLCHERPLVLNDRFHRHGLFLIDVCTTCYERPPDLRDCFWWAERESFKTGSTVFHTDAGITEYLTNITVTLTVRQTWVVI